MYRCTDYSHIYEEYLFIDLNIHTYQFSEKK